MPAVVGVALVGVRLLFLLPELPKLSLSSTLSAPFSASTPRKDEMNKKVRNLVCEIKGNQLTKISTCPVAPTSGY